MTEERERLAEVGRSVEQEAPDPVRRHRGRAGPAPRPTPRTEVEEPHGGQGLADDVERQIAGIDAALARIDDGTWGVCEVCGKAIDDERLEARPEATTCRDHM